MKTIFLFVALFVSVPFVSAQEPIRVIVFGAHPDDCDMNSSGIAALFTQMGHKVKFVSLTNGNKGHHTMNTIELAARRYREAQEAGKTLGIEYHVMNNSDGELLPTLENRFAVIKLICDWEADIVITHRPNDYHPDHRNTSIIVQDAAYMVGVPKMVPNGKPLRKTPIFLYTPDRFQKPTPFSPDIVIDITSVAAIKAEAICSHESQIFEWLPWVGGRPDEAPADPAERRKFYIERYLSRSNVDRFKDAALKWYTPAQLQNIKYVEAFEICEYGAMPDQARIKQLFPMLP